MRALVDMNDHGSKVDRALVEPCRQRVRDVPIAYVLYGREAEGQRMEQRAKGVMQASVACEIYQDRRGAKRIRRLRRLIVSRFANVMAFGDDQLEAIN